MSRICAVGSHTRRPEPGPRGGRSSGTHLQRQDHSCRQSAPRGVAVAVEGDSGAVLERLAAPHVADLTWRQPLAASVPAQHAPRAGPSANGKPVPLTTHTRSGVPPAGERAPPAAPSAATAHAAGMALASAAQAVARTAVIALRPPASKQPRAAAARAVASAAVIAMKPKSLIAPKRKPAPPAATARAASVPSAALRAAALAAVTAPAKGLSATAVPGVPPFPPPPCVLRSSLLRAFPSQLRPLQVSQQSSVLARSASSKR